VRWLKRWGPYVLLMVFVAFVVIATWFLYHIYFGRLS
jgi:hypothetical protein